MRDLDAAVSDVDNLESAATVGTIGAALMFVASVVSTRSHTLGAIAFAMTAVVLAIGGVAYFDHYPEMLIWAVVSAVFLGAEIREHKRRLCRSR